MNEKRNDTYKRLAKIAGSVGIDEGKFYELLEISDKPGPDGSLNSGNKVRSPRTSTTTLSQFFHFNYRSLMFKQVTNDLKVLVKVRDCETGAVI